MEPASSVLVSLSADDTISHHVIYPERRIILDKDYRSILVGRSSKAPTKNLLALPTNAWFDSPVMSRNHAEITANLEERKVQIRDMDSLHGTYINSDENKVGREAQDLKDGDMLRFGIAVIRGGEIFPPTAVKVALTFYNAHPLPTPSVTFQVPDSSDVSDEEDSSDADSHSDARGDLPEPTQTRTDDMGLKLAQNSKSRDVPEMTDLSSAQLDGALGSVEPSGCSSSHPIDLSSPSPASEVSDFADDEHQATASIHGDPQHAEHFHAGSSREPTDACPPLESPSFSREKFISVITDVASLAARAYPSSPAWSPELGETNGAVGHPEGCGAEKHSSPESVLANNLPPIHLLPQTYTSIKRVTGLNFFPPQENWCSKSSVLGDDDECVLPSIRDHPITGKDVCDDKEGDGEEEEDDDGGPILLNVDSEDDKSSNAEDTSVKESYKADTPSCWPTQRHDFSDDDELMDEPESDLSEMDYQPELSSDDDMLDNERGVFDWNSRSSASSEISVNSAHQQPASVDNAPEPKSAALASSSRSFPIQGLLNDDIPARYQKPWSAAPTNVEVHSHEPTMDSTRPLEIPTLSSPFAHHMYHGALHPPLFPVPIKCADPRVSGNLGHRFGKGEFFAAREENKMRMMQEQADAYRFHGTTHLNNHRNAATYDGFYPAWGRPNAAPLSEHRRTHVGISDIVESSQPTNTGASEHDAADSGKGKRKADVISEARPIEYRWHLESMAPCDGPDPGKGVAPGKEAALAPAPLPSAQPAFSFSGFETRHSTNTDAAPIVEHGLPLQKTAGSILPDADNVRLGDESTSSSTSSPPIDAQPMVAHTFAPALIEPVPQITITPTVSCRVEEASMRPVKRARLRKLVEGIGYAALGGLTVGTVVFGSLVYTAPSMG